MALLFDSDTLHSLPELLFFNQKANEALVFRPLLHLLLALQVWLFHFNFFYWQIMPFVLHLIVLWRAARIFQKISTSSFGYALIALFSVLTISAEMVTWPHISGYLIFILCFLQALTAFIDILEGKDQILRMTFWLLLGSLFYEFSVVSCVIFFIALQFTQKPSKIPKAHSWLVLMPLAIIVPFFLSTISQHKISHQLNFAKWISSLSEILAGIPYALLPTMLSFQPNLGRSYLNGLAFQKFDIPFCVNVLAIVLLFLWVAYGLKRNQNTDLSKNRLLSRTIGLLFVLHACFVAVRVALHPLADYMHLSLYHYYFTLLLAFLWLTTTIFTKKESQNRLLSGILMIAVSLLIMVNAFQTHRTYQALSQRMSPWIKFFNATNQFVNSHKIEDNFSIRVVYTEFSLPIPVKRSDGSPDTLPEFELLFKPYISDHPTYFLVYFHNTGLKIFTTQNEALEFTALSLSKTPTR